MTQHSNILKLDVPDDFPLALLEQFHDAVWTHRESNPAECGQWAGACNALHYRFLACAEADETFRSSLTSAGPAPPPPERARQEKALFAFFSSGLSALECLGFGLYHVGAIVDPHGFTAQPKNIWLSTVVKSYGAQFQGERIAAELSAVEGSAGLREWKNARNILMHQVSPPRSHFARLEDTLGSTAEPPDNALERSDWLGEELSSATTADPRAWLVTSLTEILEGACDFASTHL
jgi:hypothetical protein